jgi:hypothetical protein
VGGSYVAAEAATHKTKTYPQKLQAEPPRKIQILRENKSPQSRELLRVYSLGKSGRSMLRPYKGGGVADG